MKNKLYYLVGIFLVVFVGVGLTIYFTSSKKGNVIDIVTPAKESVFHRVSSIILGPGTSQNLYYHRAGWFLKKAEFRLPELSGKDFSITALVTVKGQKPREEDWTQIGKKIFCLDHRAENLQDVVLTIANNSASTTLREDINVFGLRDGCNEWSGTVRYEWEDSNKTFNEKGVLQAVFTLKENTYATEYIVRDGGYSYNTISCAQDKEVKTVTLISDGMLAEDALRLVPVDGGSFELKFPIVWGKLNSAKEYVKRNRTCIYGRERGDTARDLELTPVYTLKEVTGEKFILTPDVVTGNLKGEKEIEKTLENGATRKLKVTWDLARQ